MFCNYVGKQFIALNIYLSIERNLKFQWCPREILEKKLKQISILLQYYKYYFLRYFSRNLVCLDASGLLLPRSAAHMWFPEYN